MVEKQNQFYFGAYTFRCLSCIFEGYFSLNGFHACDVRKGQNLKE